MKLALFSQEEPCFMNPMLISVLEKRKGDIKYVGLFGEREGGEKTKGFSEYLERLLTYYFMFGNKGFFDMCKKKTMYKMFKTSRGDNDNYSLERACKRLSIPVYCYDSLQNKEVKTNIEDHGIELILNQTELVIDDEILKMPKKGVINRHGSLLPRHKGRMASYWSYVEGQDYGITIHLLDKKLDSGDIVIQERLDISPNEPYYEVISKIFNQSPCLIDKAFSLLDDPSFVPTPMKKNDEKRKKFPGLKQAFENRKVHKQR